VDRDTAASFDRLLDQALEHGPERPLDYRLDAPKWQFLCHAADRAGVVLHGSGVPDIARFEPRQPADDLEFSNRLAVFAAADGIWPIYFAIADREHLVPMILMNACVRLDDDAGRLSEPYYYFSVSAPALKHRPWRTGTVYLLPADSFEHQPPIPLNGTQLHVAQAASPVAVEPIAKLTVHPDDFPFLHQVHGHDDALINARAAADPDGFPWFEENDETAEAEKPEET